MSNELLTIVLTSLAAAISAPVGAWVNSRLLRQKYDIEIGKLRAGMESEIADARNKELDALHKASNILMEDIVRPLKTEIQSLRRDVNKFRKAIEKIPSCPMADTCPVSKQLLADEADSEQRPS